MLLFQGREGYGRCSLSLLWGVAYHLHSCPAVGSTLFGPVCWRSVLSACGFSFVGWGSGSVGGCLVAAGGLGVAVGGGVGGFPVGWGLRPGLLASLVGVLALLVCLLFRVLVWVAWVAVGWFRLAGVLAGSLGSPHAQCFSFGTGALHMLLLGHVC